MKRYISSVLLVVVILLSVGTYYVHVATSASNLPQFTFKTVEGEEKELKSIIVTGDYRKGNVFNSLTIESNKIKYSSELSYFERMVGFSDPNNKRLVNEYRSFMRGKDYIDSYYEDQDNLTFVSVINDDENEKFVGHFNIDILEKKTKDEKSFEIELPNQGKYNDIVIRDVQFVQSKLQIITQNDVTSNDEKSTEEIHLYIIDLAGKKIASDEMLLTETFDASNQGHFARPSKVDEGKANNVFVMALVKGSYIDEEGFKEKKGESSLFAYHYDTKKSEKIKLPIEADITFESVQSDFSYDEENLYMIGWKEGKTRFYKFDINKQKIINDFTFTLENVNSIKVMDGRIYVLTSDDNHNLTNKLLITDGESGKTLYKGELVTDSDEQEKNKNQSMYLNEVYIK